MPYKPLSDSTLRSMTKDKIIKSLRITEHNFEVMQEKSNNQFEENKKLIQENEKLKSMLKTVADDISSFENVLVGNNCRLPCEKCLYYNDGKDECVYKHMDEIKNSIGGEE